MAPWVGWGQGGCCDHSRACSFHSPLATVHESVQAAVGGSQLYGRCCSWLESPKSRLVLLSWPQGAGGVQGENLGADGNVT